MAVITGSWILDLLFLTATLIGGIYLFYWHQFQFWKKRNVPHTKPSFLFGDLKRSFSLPRGLVFKELYDNFKGEPFFGAWMLFKPTIVIRDPDLIKQILVKDFDSFHDRGIYSNEKADPLSAHLFNIGGNKWRNLRTKLTPTFTSGKMKMMFPILRDCSEELKHLLKESARRGDVVEMKEIAARFTTDIISLCAFGIQTNSLKNPDAVFRKIGKKVFQFSRWKNMKDVVRSFLPALAEFLQPTFVSKDITEFFLGAFKETIDLRQEKNIKRNDFMQLLMQLMIKGKLDDVNDGVTEIGNSENLKKLTFLEAAAQAFLFFAAGFETSSTTMQFTLYELSLHHDIQEKVREEILKVLAKHNGEKTYEAIYEMDYLGRVIDETLRKYPVAPFLFRQCNKDYHIPNTKAVIPAGTHVQIPILGIHMDPEYFPNPERFDPERFTEEEKSKRHHYSYLPFGEGPRNCIGMRFGLMQVRVGLATLLSNFRFEVCKESQVPIVFDRKSVLLVPEKGMNLKITIVKKN